MIPSVDVRTLGLMGPPTATKLVFAKIISDKSFVVPESREVQEAPSGEVRMVPLIPTTANLLFE